MPSSVMLGLFWISCNQRAHPDCVATGIFSEKEGQAPSAGESNDAARAREPGSPVKRCRRDEQVLHHSKKAPCRSFCMMILPETSHRARPLHRARVAPPALAQRRANQSSPVIDVCIDVPLALYTAKYYMQRPMRCLRVIRSHIPKAVYSI